MGMNYIEKRLNIAARKEIKNMILLFWNAATPIMDHDNNDTRATNKEIFEFYCK